MTPHLGHGIIAAEIDSRIPYSLTLRPSRLCRLLPQSPLLKTFPGAPYPSGAGRRRQAALAQFAEIVSDLKR